MGLMDAVEGVAGVERVQVHVQYVRWVPGGRDRLQVFVTAAQKGDGR